MLVLPERPVVKNDFLDRVKDIIEVHGWAYIVTGEGAVWDDGAPVSASDQSDEFSNTEFGAMGGASAALTLHGILSKELGVRGEFQITESLSMCASDRVATVDVEEAYACGRRAVELGVSGSSGVMVTIERTGETPYRSTNGIIDLSKVAEKTKPMPEKFLSNDAYNVSDAFFEYLAPLVGPLPTYAEITA